jgi:hypothetical protein
MSSPSRVFDTVNFVMNVVAKNLVIGSRERSRMSTASPISTNTGSASLTSRQLLDISPGQVCSLREEPLIIRMRATSVVAPLRRQDRLACREPIHREFILRIGEARPRLARHRRFARMAVGIPRCVDDGVDLALQRLERGIDEPVAVPPHELLARQFSGRHPFADVRRRHVSRLIPV